MNNLIFPKKYDLIVVGAGHAGCEAALAASRMGAETLLLTINLNTIAQMSCNPAIGGPGKGHLAREIGALGGEMANIIDQAGIQFRMLNKKKGPAVWAPRAQADKLQYHLLMKKVLEEQTFLEIKQFLVSGLVVTKKQVKGVITNTKLVFLGETVIIAGGTFFNGLIHIGGTALSGGRLGEFASIALPEYIKKIGLEINRLKTGTPTRVHQRSIDYSAFIAQPGDKNPCPFSYDTKKIDIKQVDCYLGYTNQKTHKLIRDNLHRSPLFTGKIKGVGVRYCPSIEDKVVRFAEHNRHQIFFEPEGRDTKEIYLNGLSTSLPQDVQLKMFKTIPGLINAEVMKFGYGIEYDFINPLQLYATLETKKIKNLYFAGQINGTTGYEEAACQGIIAGINAVLKIRGQKPFVLERTQAYIGVLIDDLVTKGTQEPYRLFTSRVEHRLILRQDNADLRLSQFAYKFGLISKQKIAKIKNKQQAIIVGIDKLNKLKHANNAFSKILKQPGVTYKKLLKLDSRLTVVSQDVEEQIEIELKYAGYIQREKTLIERLKKLEDKKIPAEFAFHQIKGLKQESKEKLIQIKPRSIGQAMRISGVSSSDLSLVLLHIDKPKKSKK
ncbi:MAG: tRNA uridine-5-carboxymethylaminomethyl(34) synthesis enzyme MnmG [Candidatus Omnitrophota bacterium]|nr:MAG: tRNA uridine-5-carboxymethylaminomethyl(34) synthesis enzyme MnmG [Candidatus Omnitrophota bacterium]